MTHQKNFPFANKIAEKGLGAIPELTQVLISNAIRKMYLCWQVIELIKRDGYFWLQISENRLRNRDIPV